MKKKFLAARVVLIVFVFSLLFPVVGALAVHALENEQIWPEHDFFQHTPVTSFDFEKAVNPSVSRGERPPIDLYTVPVDAMEQGKMYVKFMPFMADYLHTVTFKNFETGVLKTGIKDIDQLNAKYNVRKQQALFEALYYSNSKSNQFAARHREWGFHLWYELELDAAYDVREAVKDYNALNYIEIAAPVYKKQLITSVSFDVTAGLQTGFFKDKASPERGQIHNGKTTEPEMDCMDNDIPGAEVFDPLEIFEPKREIFEPTDSVSEAVQIEPLSGWVPNDPRLGDQWHYQNTGQTGGTAGADIDLLRAWEIEKGSSNVVVAIIDDGVQYNHPDLAANMWSDGAGGYGYNFVRNSSVINPGDHGTHVAGTVAAVSNNETGVAGIAGGSGSGDGVRLMSCQVFDGNSAGGFHLAPVWAADRGASISQNSWGYSSPGVYDQVVLDAIDYFNEHGGGSVLDGGITIFAAGNDDHSGNWYPGYYSGAMAVAATNHADQKSYYSNYGAWVEISAPGGELYFISDFRGVLSTVTGSGYDYFQGTSMACPHVSGVAALILSLAPGQMSAAELRDLLKATTDNHYGVNPGYAGQLGTGRLNAFNALEIVANPPNVENPANFQATAVSDEQIDLNWENNAAGQDVILIYAMENQFGNLADGQSYAVGEEIAGGGTVLYLGDADFFEHTELDEDTNYYYKLHAYNENYEYSTGLAANARTYLAPIRSFPWTETFEDDSLTREMWTQNQESGTNSWTFAQGAGGGSIYNAKSGLLNARFTATGEGPHITKLVTPLLDITAIPEPELRFWYGQEVWLPWEDQNELKVYYRTGSASPWILLFHDAESRSDWVEKVIPLPEPGATYQIAFEGVDNWGWPNVIDDVTVENAPTVRNPQNFQATVVNEQQIDLSWEKNDAEQDVLLIYSTHNQFGSLTDGQSYSVGQEIAGGGTVLYLGAGIIFEHSGLEEGTTCYYRLHAYNELFEYSSGLAANAKPVKIKTAYGWAAYTPSGIPTGPTTITIPHGELQSIRSVDVGTIWMSGGDFVGETWYAVSYSEDDAGLYIIDRTSGAYELVGNTGQNLNSFTYDLAGDVAYVTGYNHDNQKSLLYSIDLFDAQLTLMGETGENHLFMGIAANAEGALYGVCLVTDKLYTMDKATGEATSVGNLGIVIN